MLVKVINGEIVIARYTYINTDYVYHITYNPCHDLCCMMSNDTEACEDVNCTCIAEDNNVLHYLNVIPAYVIEVR